MKRINKEPWFKPLDPQSPFIYFQGPVPITWQGWTIVFLFFLSIFLEIFIIKHIFTNIHLAIAFIIIVLPITIMIFLIIALQTGMGDNFPKLDLFSPF